MGAQVGDRRNHGIRRDLNALVRGKDGEISGSKIGTYTAQYIAAKILLELKVLPAWDVLTVLFIVLIAPELYKKLMEMRWSGGASSETREMSKTTITKETSK